MHIRMVLTPGCGHIPLNILDEHLLLNFVFFLMFYFRAGSDSHSVLFVLFDKTQDGAQVPPTVRFIIPYSYIVYIQWLDVGNYETVCI